MKVSEPIKTGQHGFEVYAFVDNFSDVNFFTGSGFTANLLFLIFFGENGFSVKQCHGTKHFISGYFVSGEASKR